MIEPGRGSSSLARRLPASSCPSSSKRWKKEEAWMAEMCPRSSVRLFACPTGGGGPDGDGAEGERLASSNTSQAKNFAGYVSGVVLNSLCPSSQNPVGRWVVNLMRRVRTIARRHTCFVVRADGLGHWPPIVDGLPHICAHYPEAKASVRSSRQPPG